MRHGLRIENDGQDDEQQQGAHHVAAAAEHGVAEEFIVPRYRGAPHDVPHAAEQEPAAEKIEQHGDEDHEQEGHPTVPGIVVDRRDPQPGKQGIGPAAQKVLQIEHVGHNRFRMGRG